MGFFMGLLHYDSPLFDQAIANHDQSITDAGVDIWIGAEPTFTDRQSEAPEWLGDAQGSDKKQRAYALLGRLIENFHGGLVLRTLGRQYTAEARPRWSIGYYNRRDGQPLWQGPTDPIIIGQLSQDSKDYAMAQALWQALTEKFINQGWEAATFKTGRRLGLRIAFRFQGPLNLPRDINTHPDYSCGSIHNQSIPHDGLIDSLAQQGVFLLKIGTYITDDADEEVVCIELPAFPDPHHLQLFINQLEQAANAIELNHLILRGFPPPVDQSVSWFTVTPDPGVVEINMAPTGSISDFSQHNLAIFAAAEHIGLSAFRLNYNGNISDSGGGGQITLGGATPESSPFFIFPDLLPKLIYYFNRHPALSYYFAFDSIGSSSQSPRPDERTRESFEELQLSLELLLREPPPSSQLLWESLASFLADPSGNTHRSEINIEKLWNPYLPQRGCQGLVEFRAFRMPRSSEALTALATLLRSITAMLTVQKPEPQSLVDWGPLLHDKFALPFYLRRDLTEIFTELNHAGVGLAPCFCDCLLDDGHRLIGKTRYSNIEIIIKKAVEFWPLLGDVASQERGTSRWVDGSTARIEIILRPSTPDDPDFSDWQVIVDNCRLPMLTEHGEQGPMLIKGLRYCSFKPWKGVHPTLNAHGPVEIMIYHPRNSGALSIVLHDWRPDGASYAGLPHNLDEVRQRIAERFVVKKLTEYNPKEVRPPSPSAMTDFCLDLRRL